MLEGPPDCAKVGTCLTKVLRETGRNDRGDIDGDDNLAIHMLMSVADRGGHKKRLAKISDCVSTTIA